MVIYYLYLMENQNDKKKKYLLGVIQTEVK